MDEKETERMQGMLSAMYKSARSSQYAKENFTDGSTAWIDGARMALLSTPVPVFGCKVSVEIRESSIHGLGVFATRNMDENTCFTFYLGDVVEYYPDGNRTTNHRKVAKCSTRAVPYMKQEKDLAIAMQALEPYALTVDKRVTVTGHPLCKDDPWNIGHFVNDRFSYDGDKMNGDIYLKLSSKRANCKYHIFGKNLHVGLITTRQITKDEELFATYGVDYWKTQLIKTI